MEELLVWLNAISPISPDLSAYLLGALMAREVAKDSYILRAGQICRNIYFIHQGLLRCYYEKDGEQVSAWFMKEGDVIVSRPSFFEQVPSYEYIQALEPCLLLGITYDQLQHIYHTYPEFNIHGRVLLEKYYAGLDRHLYSLKMSTAKERYDNLLQNEIELIQRVPQKFLASYLGMTVETLSRVRSKK